LLYPAELRAHLINQKAAKPPLWTRI
jgi:hypothetical protein